MSRYLLDTHGLIWWWTDVGRLGQTARAAIEGDGNRIVVSAASVWEIATKVASGRLPEIEDFRRDYRPLMLSNGFETCEVDDEHAMLAGFLPGDHRDPFDRMIAAQALIEDIPVITRDREFAGFGCKVIW